MDWFLFDNSVRHERVKRLNGALSLVKFSNTQAKIVWF